MPRFSALALALAPVALSAVAAPAFAQAPARGLAQVQSNLRAVETMTAAFTQTDRRGRTLSGTLTIKRPGRIRFDYGRSANMLIVGDGRALNFVDYDVRQVQRWPIGNSPLSVLLNPNKSLDGIGKVVTDSDQVLMIQARDPKKPEFGTISIAFAKIPSAPQGLMLQGWTTIDSQNNRTTIRLSNQRFNVAVADTAFRWNDPRKKGRRG